MQARAKLTNELPEIIASMKALVNQGTPMLGSTLDSGVISAPARQARPAPRAKVDNRTWELLTPSARARVSFIVTARVISPSRVPLSTPAKPAATSRARPIKASR